MIIRLLVMMAPAGIWRANKTFPAWMGLKASIMGKFDNKNPSALLFYEATASLSFAVITA